jgi:hypothetical protein
MRLFVAIIETDNGDGIWILETNNSLKMGAYLVGGGRGIKDGLSFSGKCGSLLLKMGAYLVGGGREIKDGLSFSGKCGSRWMKKGD